MNLNLPANVTYQPPTWAKIGNRLYNLGHITYIHSSIDAISFRSSNGDCFTIYKNTDPEEYADALKLIETLRNPIVTMEVVEPPTFKSGTSFPKFYIYNPMISTQYWYIERYANDRCYHFTDPTRPNKYEIRTWGVQQESMLTHNLWIEVTKEEALAQQLKGLTGETKS